MLGRAVKEFKKATATPGSLSMVHMADDNDDYNPPLLHLYQLTPDHKKMKAGVPLTLMATAGGKYIVYIVREPYKEDFVALCHVANVDGHTLYQKGIMLDYR